jgi:hypothetical protein
MTRRNWALVGVAVVAGGLGASPVGADDWADPAGDALGRTVSGIESSRTRGGMDATLAVVAGRRDEVSVYADLARVDVTLEVENHGSTREWRRFLVMAPEADLVAASYVRPDGLETAARSMRTDESSRIYQRAVNPSYGRDPLIVQRENPRTLDVSIFPVDPGQGATLRLTLVTPLEGRGTERLYRDPLPVRALRVAAPRTKTGEGAAPGVPVMQRTSGDPSREDAVSGIALRLDGFLPAGLPEGTSVTRAADGAVLVNAVGSADTTEIPLRALRAATPAVAISGGSRGGFAFAWRVDPEEQFRALGVQPRIGRTLRLRSTHAGATARIAPETVDSTSTPTVVMGRTSVTSSVAVTLEALDAFGRVLATGDVTVPCGRGQPGDSMEEAMRAYHRSRLVERVFRWADGDAKKTEAARAYAVDLGVVGRGVTAIAVPRDERGFLTKPELKDYLHDGAPIGVEDDDGRREAVPPPSGSVK